MILAKQIAPLQIILPLFGGLFSILSFNVKFSRIIALVAIFLDFILSIYGFNQLLPSSYVFGDWGAYYGIEHKLDHLNQPIIVLLNGLLLFILLFYHNQINKSILQILANNKKHLFYAVLLFAHTGFVGMLSTNDLFNLYVFIEVSSLSTYVLLCQGKNRKALIGGFNYLVMGTISATFILMGIGFLFSLKGDLNMVAAFCHQHDALSNLISYSIGFISIGCFLKIALFPMHLWLIDVYRSSSAIILCYLGSISALVGIYLFLRLFYVIDYDNKYQYLWHLIKIISICGAVFCARLAFRADNFKTLIGYSAAAQISVILLILSYPEGKNLALKYLFTDVLGKLFLFSIVVYYEFAEESLNFAELKALPDKSLLRCIVVLLLLCNAGLPFTAMFILKLSALDLALSFDSYTIFIALIIHNLFSLQYNYKIFKGLFFSLDEAHKSTALFNITPLLLILICQFGFVMFFEKDFWPLIPQTHDWNQK